MAGNQGSLSNFHYTDAQASRIWETFHAAGLQSKREWPRYRRNIALIVQIALSKAKAPPLPYARPAGKRLDQLMKKLGAAVEAYDALAPELQYTINSNLCGALQNDPLLMASLLPWERPVVERLLSSGRFLLALKVVRNAADLAAGPLRHVGKPAVVSEELLSMLPSSVSTVVKKNAKQPRADNIFQVKGAPKNHAIRYAVRALWPIFEEATGKQPVVYASEHEPEGYGGNFYKFAAAVLCPINLVDKKVLGSNILTAYNEFRSWFAGDHPKKKVKTPG